MGDFDCCANGEHEPKRLAFAWADVPGDTPARVALDATIADLATREAAQLEEAVETMLTMPGDNTLLVWRWTEHTAASLVFHQATQIVPTVPPLEPLSIAYMPTGTRPPEAQP